MARFKITGNSPFCGEGFGMEWLDGVAYTDSQDIADYLKGKTYKVEEISRETPTEDTGEQPEEKLTADPAQVLACPHCGKEYKTKTGLAKHIKMDHPESPEAMAE